MAYPGLQEDESDRVEFKSEPVFKLFSNGITSLGYVFQLLILLVGMRIKIT